MYAWRCCWQKTIKFGSVMLCALKSTSSLYSVRVKKIYKQLLTSWISRFLATLRVVDKPAADAVFVLQVPAGYMVGTASCFTTRLFANPISTLSLLTKHQSSKWALHTKLRSGFPSHFLVLWTKSTHFFL